MPYRRLPNTDNARIKALRTAIDNIRFNGQKEFMSLDIRGLELILRNFESVQILYKSSLEAQAASNRKFQKLVKNARLYISHFIQVLNLCVIRGEIKKDAKLLYGLEPNGNNVPDLSSNETVLQWGESIINGEKERLTQGGTPIYNPTIARVNVAFSQFKDGYVTQRTFKSTTSRHLDNLTGQREGVDKVLYKLWNEIESCFANLNPSERLDKCKEFGVVYYLRRGETWDDIN